ELFAESLKLQLLVGAAVTSMFPSISGCPASRELDRTLDRFGDTGLLEELGEKSLAVTHPSVVVVGVVPKRGDELLIVDLPASERVAHHTGEVTTIDTCGSKVVHRSNHRRDRKPINHRPLSRANSGAVNANVRSPRLPALFAGELVLIRLDVPELVDHGRRSV